MAPSGGVRSLRISHQTITGIDSTPNRNITLSIAHLPAASRISGANPGTIRPDPSRPILRDLILTATIIGLLPVILRYPACGVLTWAWFSILSPHQQVYGFAHGQPFGLAIAVATLGGWLISRERKRWTPDAMPWLMLAFFAWITFNSFFAPFPNWSWPLWDRTLRIFVFVFLVFILINNRPRIHALIWVTVVCIGYFGIKGGLFTILKGGSYIVYGPTDTILQDNNQLALAVVMSIPLVNYLRLHTGARWLRVVLGVAFVLQIIMVFGSYSRGGVIALGVMLTFFWWRSERKVLYGIAAVAVVAAGLSMMPDSFYERMATIQDARQDSSFEGRVTAWHVATYYAEDHFPFGAGFSGAELPPIFNHYYPDAQPHAAHSIYFEVLGDHGFPALAIYLLILALGLRNTMIVVRQARGQPGLRWAYDLARMLQVSLISFYVGGAALSVAYYDTFLSLLAVVSVLREITGRSGAARAVVTATPEAAPERVLTPLSAMRDSPAGWSAFPSTRGGHKNQGENRA